MKSQILDEARAAAESKLSAARAEADKILAEAKAEAEKCTESISKKSEMAIPSEKERGASANDLQRYMKLQRKMAAALRYPRKAEILKMDSFLPMAVLKKTVH